MNRDEIAVTRECTQASLAGKWTFPEVVGRLHAIGVERYHADLSRGENTFYLPSGDSHVVTTEHAPGPIAAVFSAANVEAAVRAAQRGEVVYTEFLQRIAQAGCVGYFVQIAGRRALYFGRGGEVHLEPFPSAA